MAEHRERSFIMIKPDAVHRGLIGTIIERFEKKGFKLVAMKFMFPSEQLIRQHYCCMTSMSFYSGLIKYMSSGPVIPMVWEGLDVVKTGRQMIGTTTSLSADSKLGTIRGDLAVYVGRNGIHGADSVETAKKEIALWFNENELNAWTPAVEKWIYQ